MCEEGTGKVGTLRVEGPIGMRWGKCGIWSGKCRLGNRRFLNVDEIRLEVLEEVCWEVLK